MQHPAQSTTVLYCAYPNPNYSAAAVSRRKINCFCYPSTYFVHTPNSQLTAKLKHCCNNKPILYPLKFFRRTYHRNGEIKANKSFVVFYYLNQVKIFETPCYPCRRTMYEAINAPKWEIEMLNGSLR